MSKNTEIPFALDTVEMNGFRLFGDCIAKLHPKLTVLIAPNSGGKTAFLDGVANSLKSYLNHHAVGFTGTDHYHSPETVTADDLNFSLRCEIKLSESYIKSFPFLNPELVISSPLKVEIKPSANLSSEGKTLLELDKNFGSLLGRPEGFGLLVSSSAYISAKNFRYHLLKKSDVSLPLLAYFTANRRVIKSGKSSSNPEFELSKQQAFLSLLPCEGIKNFTEWLRERAINGLEQRLEFEEVGDTSTPEPDTHLRAVSRVLSTMLSYEVDITNVRYFYKTKSIQAVKANGEQVDIDQLSHGAKSILTIAAEIAMNCCALNPHLKEHAPEKTPGIILIDEVDLHLHPQWQQNILDNLQQCFPCMQFIVSTHSPAVLTTVRKENIREIQIDSETGVATVNEPVSRSYGESSGDLQETIMNVPARPDNESVQALQTYLNWAENGDLNEDKSAEYDALVKDWGTDHTDLLMAEMIVKRRQIIEKHS